MIKSVLGNKNEKIIVFYTFQKVHEFNLFKKAMDVLVNNNVLQKTLFIVFLEDEKSKLQLPESARFRYLAKSDFNFLGQIKDKELRHALKDKFDTLFVFGSMDDKNSKRINKVNAKQRIVTNSTQNINFDISINSNADDVEQIANFTSETLEKIQL